MGKINFRNWNFEFMGLPVGAIVVALLIVAAGSWGVTTYQARHALKRAMAQLEKGLPVVAAETIDPYREALVKKSEQDCRVVIAIYYQARRPERLEWAAQACLDEGKVFPEAFVGWAAAREFIGRDAEALQILGNAAPKFDKVPSIYYSMAQIFRRNKRDDEAIAAFRSAIERAPNDNQLAIETAEYLYSLKKFADAKKLVDKLKDVKTDNPEVKLFLARVYLANQDKGTARTLASEANELISKHPEMKPAYEKGYSDVFALMKP